MYSLNGLKASKRKQKVMNLTIVELVERFFIHPVAKAAIAYNFICASAFTSTTVNEMNKMM
jgi:hypothetical protein